MAPRGPTSNGPWRPGWNSGRRLNHSGFAVALPHGNAAEKTTSEAIAAQLQDAWVWPAMGLDALTDTLARCAGVVGVDSGLSHIAVALGLPHVQIYNFDTAWRTGPDSPRQVSVFAKAAARCRCRLAGVGQPGHAGAVSVSGR